MSGQRVHLPVAGDRHSRMEDAPTLCIAEDSERRPLPTPSIAIAGAGASKFAAALQREFGHRSRVWVAELRAREGAELTRGNNGEWILRASGTEMDTGIEKLIERDADPMSDVTIAVGAPFIASWRATISVLVTLGVPVLEWERSIRDLRGRFDLVISEPRPILARELSKRVILDT